MFFPFHHNHPCGAESRLQPDSQESKLPPKSYFAARQMPGFQSRECQQCGVTTVQISFPDFTTVSDALCVQETNSDTHHESLPNSFEKPSISIASSQPREASPSFPSASSSKKITKQSITKAALDCWQWQWWKVTVPPLSLAHGKAEFSENM